MVKNENVILFSLPPPTHSYTIILLTRKNVNNYFVFELPPSSSFVFFNWFFWRLFAYFVYAFQTARRRMRFSPPNACNSHDKVTVAWKRKTFFRDMRNSFSFFSDQCSKKLALVCLIRRNWKKNICCTAYDLSRFISYRAYTPPSRKNRQLRARAISRPIFKQPFSFHIYRSTSDRSFRPSRFCYIPRFEYDDFFFFCSPDLGQFFHDTWTENIRDF